MKAASRLALFIILSFSMSALAEPQPKSVCTKDSIATKFNVPNEPDVALPILAAIITRDNHAPQKAESRILRVFFDNRKDPKIICIEWDLVKPVKILDFVTCRRAEREGNKLHMDPHPVNYIVDTRQKKVGAPKPKNLDVFLDSDVDGDICDPEFSHVGKFSDLGTQNPPQRVFCCVKKSNVL